MKLYKSNTYFRDLKDIYLGYTHKWMDVNSKVITRPYFSKKEISNHKYKLGYKEWKVIIKSYLKNVFLYILDGNVFPIPHGLGLLSINKTRRKLIDKKASVKAKTPVARKMMHTYGFKPRIYWNVKRSDLKYKSFYKFYFVRPLWTKMMDIYEEDGSQILKLKDDRIK